jgi:hypothetical protein
MLSFFGRHVSDYPWNVHVIPCLYFILYTFLIRHALLDATGARDDDERRTKVEYAFIGGSLAFYLLTHILEG